jgi:hypothetical protein
MRRQDLKIWVEELNIVESGTYSDQFLRPYVTEVKGGIIDRIEERYAKSRRFTPSLLANIANQFIVPDYETRGIIDIPHGWGTRRGRFILTLVIEVGTGDRLKQVVMGYTNSVGFTTRHVDHDMEFYVNSTFMLTEKTVRSRSGRYERVYVPHKTADVLSDRENAGLRRRGERLFTMRPEDVFSSLDSEQTQSLVDDVTDLRTTLSKNAIKSSTSNRLGSRFMSNVLNSRQKALENSEFGGAVADINATAQGYVQESYTSDDIFLRQISNIRGKNVTVDSFTFKDLLQIDPDAEDRTNPLLLDKEALAVTRYDEGVNQLDGQEEEDRIAALVGIAVPALMMECGIHAINFQVHNQALGHQWEFVPQNARSFVKDMEMSSFLDLFEDRIIDELLLPITAGNDFDVGLKVNCRAFGEVDFTMFWDGKNRGRYVIPVFTNALASPIVTDSLDDVRKMGRDFSDLFDQFLPSDLAGGSGRGFGF